MAGQRHAGPEGNKAGGTEVSADLLAAGMFSETEQKDKNGTGSTHSQLLWKWEREGAAGKPGHGIGG